MWSISDQSTVMGCMGVNSSAGTATIELLHMLILAYSLHVSYRLGVHIPLHLAIISTSYVDAYQSTKPECGEDRQLEPGLNTSESKIYTPACAVTRASGYLNGLTRMVASTTYHRNNLCLQIDFFLVVTTLDLHLKKEENMCYIVINTNI